MIIKLCHDVPQLVIYISIIKNNGFFANWDYSKIINKLSCTVAILNIVQKMESI